MRRCLDRLRLRASRGLYGCSAVLAYGPADFAFTNTSAKRPLQSGEVRIEVEACGICASDVKMFKGSEDLDSCFYEIANEGTKKEFLRPVLLQSRAEHIFVFRDGKLAGFFNINFCKVDILTLALDTMDEGSNPATEIIYGIELTKGKEKTQFYHSDVKEINN